MKNATPINVAISVQFESGGRVIKHPMGEVLDGEIVVAETKHAPLACFVDGEAVFRRAVEDVTVAWWPRAMSKKLEKQSRFRRKPNEDGAERAARIRVSNRYIFETNKRHPD